MSPTPSSASVAYVPQDSAYQSEKITNALRAFEEILQNQQDRSGKAVTRIKNSDLREGDVIHLTFQKE